MPKFEARRGLYFEEFEVGQRMSTVGRTITEADVVNFAGVSADYNLIHTDIAYSTDSFFKQRVAHGMLVLSVASGLAMRTGLLEGTVIAWRDIRDWRFSQPVFIGDTVHVELEVVDAKPIPRLGGGQVNLGVKIINQHDKTVMKGIWGILMMSMPEDPPDALT
ncbi:MAG: MaoC/PaaZ C-terminal domain-containing protein [Anaerolineales bacterium]|nr:MaoC/PaaZ C-terminal domain-containing protein [Anaerolineales bacterium]